MIISIFILVFSLAALIQFAAFTWHAAFLSLATAEIPENMVKCIELNSFQEASAFERLCPELGEGGGGNLRAVSLYHGFLQFLTSIGDAILPPGVWMGTARNGALYALCNCGAGAADGTQSDDGC